MLVKVLVKTNASLSAEEKNSGKECTSTFIDAFADQTNGVSLSDTRTRKWKYYFSDTGWKYGTMESLKEDFNKLKINQNYDKGKIYPLPENKSAWLEKYKNWP